MIETSSTVTTTATVDVSDTQIESLVERHLRRRLSLSKEAEVSLEWRGSHCPYLHITVKHQRASPAPAADSAWTERLDDVFD